MTVDARQRRRPLMWREYAALPRLFWTLWVGVLVNRIGWVVLPFLGLYLTSHAGLTTEQAGLIVSAYGLGPIVARTATRC